MTRARDLAAFVSNADGDIKFDTDTLFVDSSANHVGISDTTPENKLTVVEDGTNVSVVKARTSASDGRVSYQIGNDADNWFMGIDGGNSDSFFISDVVSSSDRLVIDTSGNVGIGDVSPESNNNYTALTVTSTSGSGGGQVYTQSSTVSSVFGADNAGSGPKSILQTVTNHPLVLGTNNTERLRVTNDGLTFNGDTAAANALDDYEEGTWTPACTGSLSVANARYVKVGNLVNASLYITSLNPTANNSTFKITGLPYAVKTSSGYYVAGTIGYTGDNNLNDVTVLSGTTLSHFYFHLNDGDGDAVTGNDMRARGMTGASLDALIVSISYCTS